MRIAIGSDHRGCAIRSKVIESVQRLGHEVEDVGTFSPDAVDYPDVAAEAARKVSTGEVERGILICGTGCWTGQPRLDRLTAEMSRRHNDTNVLCLSADLLGARLIDRMIELWLSTPFEGGRHARRIDKIVQLENRSAGGT